MWERLSWRDEFINGENKYNRVRSVVELAYRILSIEKVMMSYDNLRDKVVRHGFIRHHILGDDKLVSYMNEEIEKYVESKLRNDRTEYGKDVRYKLKWEDTLDKFSSDYRVASRMAEYNLSLINLERSQAPGRKQRPLKMTISRVFEEYKKISGDDISRDTFVRYVKRLEE